MFDAAVRAATDPPHLNASSTGDALVIEQKRLSPPAPSTIKVPSMSSAALATARSNGASKGLVRGRKLGRGSDPIAAGSASISSVSGRLKARATSRAYCRSSPSGERVAKLTQENVLPACERQAATIEESRPPDNCSRTAGEPGGAGITFNASAPRR